MFYAVVDNVAAGVFDELDSGGLISSYEYAYFHPNRDSIFHANGHTDSLDNPHHNSFADDRAFSYARSEPADSYIHTDPYFYWQCHSHPRCSVHADQARRGISFRYDL
jgi:hypothetical protein